MNQVDTVLFDKTGTLTHDQPEVARVFAAEGWEADRILAFAEAAERKFHHPIALAIIHKAKRAGLDPLPTDDTQYKVGYGISLRIDGSAVRVGSARFMESERIELPWEIGMALEDAHREGNTMVLVAVDNRVAGAIELRAAVRSEVRRVISHLRETGIEHIAIVSGDHEAPTRKLAESLGMDRYFAQVLPADKADYVAKLQAEGRKVCFVGDGINDSIALKKADVSISLRGASSLATDTAQVVFLEGGLSRLCDLREIARDLDRNVNRSWSMIVAPNVTNMIGVFTMGFGIMTSVITNNVSALAALGNGLLPLRKVGQPSSGSQILAPASRHVNRFERDLEQSDAADAYLGFWMRQKPPDRSAHNECRGQSRHGHLPNAFAPADGNDQNDHSEKQSCGRGCSEFPRAVKDGRGKPFR